MRPGGGRDKGNAFERKVAKILTDSWGVKFVRTPNSGAFHQLAPADIIPEDKKCWDNFNFHLELKCREGWNLSQLLTSKDCVILQWYNDEVAKQVASRGDKFYEKQLLLIFSKNRDDIYVMYKNDFISLTPEFFNKKIIFQHEKTSFTIITLKEFLKIVTKETAFGENKNV